MLDDNSSRAMIWVNNYIILLLASLVSYKVGENNDRVISKFSRSFTYGVVTLLFMVTIVIVTAIYGDNIVYG